MMNIINKEIFSTITKENAKMKATELYTKNECILNQIYCKITIDYEINPILCFFMEKNKIIIQNKLAFLIEENNDLLSEQENELISIQLQNIKKKLWIANLYFLTNESICEKLLLMQDDCLNYLELNLVELFFLFKGIKDYLKMNKDQDEILNETLLFILQFLNKDIFEDKIKIITKELIKQKYNKDL